MERMCLGKIEFVIQHIVHPATGITLKVRTCAKLHLSVLIQIIVSLQNKTFMKFQTSSSEDMWLRNSETFVKERFSKTATH